MTSTTDDQILVEPSEVLRFITDCVTKAGATADHAGQLAEVLVQADLRGHYSHGLNRLDVYVQDLQKGVCAPSGTPHVLADRPSTAWVDGQNLLGPVVGNFCMRLAMAKAKTTGIGMVSTRGSNHYGIAGHYSMLALDQGFIGLTCTNTSPVMVPTRAQNPALGTNPLSLAAPAAGAAPAPRAAAAPAESFVLDMATTTVAFGKVEIAERRGENIPEGWALDDTGHVTTNPKTAKGLYPLGGQEVTSGFKGYGLAMMVEVLCGILAGGAYGPHVRRWMHTDRAADLCQCFLAIDPSGFAPHFDQRLAVFLGEMRGLENAEGESEAVLVAGDPERNHEKHCDTAGGIPYHRNQILHAGEIAETLNVPPIKVKDASKS